jgi:hypothetical protein
MVIKGDIVTMNGQSQIIRDGRLVVVGNRIQAILSPGESLPDDYSTMTELSVDGWIFPGLIDAHNHVAYNMLGIFSVDREFDNRYQWNKGKDYQQQVNYPKRLLTDSKYFKLTPEVVKYAEVKALTGGVTAIQGTPLRSENIYLVRNLEHTNFGMDRISQHGLSIDDGRFRSGTVPGWIERIGNNELDAVILHLAEGKRTDDKSRAEFTTLKSLGLLIDQTVLIHCTACTHEHFIEMAAAGTKLIWSPLSNLLLYGETTDIPAAVQADVLISLGTDWSPSGSKNLLGELKVAHEVDQIRFGNIISNEELARMVTTNPAFALGLDDKIGSLVPGYVADIAIYAKTDSEDPYLSLIQSTGRDVQLVLIDGEPLYGDYSLMTSLKPGDIEVLHVGNHAKGLDITNPTVKNGLQSFSEVVSLLSNAMEFSYEEMWEKFGQDTTFEEFENLIDEKFSSGIVAHRLDPLFAEGDTQFFSKIKGSSNARLTFDLQSYWLTGDSDQQILDLVNDPDSDVVLLDKIVMLDRRAAQNIISHRHGPDGRAGTQDDDLFDSMQELDDIPYVGRSALEKLKNYSRTHQP